MLFDTKTVVSTDFGTGTPIGKANQLNIPQIVLSPPNADDKPCITNKSPRRVPNFVGDKRRNTLAISMPPLKGMPQPVHPVVVRVRVKVSLGSQAAIVSDSTGTHERYAFPAGPDDQSVITNNVDGASNSKSNDTQSGPTSPRPEFAAPKFLSSLITAGIPDAPVSARGRPRRRSSIYLQV